MPTQSTFLVYFFCGLILTLNLACSGSDNGGAPTQSVIALCNAYCNDRPTEIASCPADTNYSLVIQSCKTECLLYRDTEDCRILMDKLVSCNANRIFQCAPNSNLITVEDPDPCSGLGSAFNTDPSAPGDCVEESEL